MSSKPVLIELVQGVLSGVREKLPNGRDYYTFKGIPYAKPPLGELRFRSPVPIEKHSEDGILDCSKEREVCFQKDIFFIYHYAGSEDCLYVNVFTPNVAKNSAKYPVMIFIHGGAFTKGSGNTDFYSPEFLIQEGVVIVTFNYRLHALGFLSLPSVGINGNAGLKDQRMVFKWVSENISKFNGDPNNVTIFGQSAGGVSAHLHLLSPNSRKYFHKVILQSGVAVMHWALMDNPEEKSRQFGKFCGCESESDEKILEFLLKTPVDVLYNNRLMPRTEDERRRDHPIVFKPIIEQPSEDAIITKPPSVLMREVNSLADIPIMTGYTDREAILMFLDLERGLNVIQNDMFRLVPRTLDVWPGSETANMVIQRMNKFFFNDHLISNDKLLDLTNLLSDNFVNVHQNFAVEINAAYQHKSPQYFYQFAFDDDLNLFKKIFLKDIPFKGACHGDELFYLFVMRRAECEIPVNSKAGQMRKKMCQMWTNFSKYGNPTPEWDDTLSFKWLAVGNKETTSKYFNLNCLYIDETIKMIQNPDKDRMDFWRDIYAKWGNKALRSKL